ncbi:MAG: hypothetical protein IJB84_00990 [Lachnospiraceae bacterium]|nr:hypothetical protein [Lachnospiraceae bacterium]
MGKKGIYKGMMLMIPVCVAGCVFTYKKGAQVVNYFKNKLSCAQKQHPEREGGCQTEEQEEVILECPICGRKAYGMDEITVIFGYRINDVGKLEHQGCCKRCRNNKSDKLSLDNMW